MFNNSIQIIIYSICLRTVLCDHFEVDLPQANVWILEANEKAFRYGINQIPLEKKTDLSDWTYIDS